MDSRDMIDQFPHFLGEVALLLPQPQHILSQAHFIPIDFIPIEPDAALWLFCVVVLEIEAERFVACAGSAHDKGAFGYCQHKSAAGEGGNALDRALHVIRRCRDSVQK
jgi:hypothetical protein